MNISKRYTPDNRFYVRSYDHSIVLFFDTKERAFAFINHPANYGRDFAFSEWKLQEFSTK